MKAYSWVMLSCLAVACGGSAFTSGSDESNGVGGSDDGGTGGSLSKAGRGSGGSVIGSGGKVGSGGKGGATTGGGVSVGGFGIAGDLISGGSFAVAGMPGVGGTGTDPGPDPIDEACPKTIPTQGGMCADGLTCSYGTDIRARCRMRAKCSSGKWAIYEPEAVCPTLHACGTDVAVNAGCDGQTASPCIKDQKLYCACVLCVGNVCSEGSWQCEGANTAGCPVMVQNEGQACAGDKTCSYGNCAVGNPMEASCNGATWGWETLGCVN